MLFLIILKDDILRIYLKQEDFINFLEKYKVEKEGIDLVLYNMINLKTKAF